MRAARAALAVSLLLTSCVGDLTTPSPSPAIPSGPTATPTPTATPSPTATPRVLRPFERVVTIPVTTDPRWVAPDRERVAYVAASGELQVIEVTTAQTKKVHTPPQGWHVDLDPHALRGDTLVFRESRTDGQRTDARIVRLDLKSGASTTLDDYSGPFLGGGDNWQARAPITNGSDVLWTRVDDTVRPFLVSVLLARGSAVPSATAPEVLSAGSSAVWVDLEDSGRALISILITREQVAELVVWSGGHPTPFASRPSADGGPAAFVAGGVFWGFGAGIAAPILRGVHFEGLGRSRALDLACAWSGTAARYLVAACPGAGTTLVDPQSGDRIVTGVGPHAGAAAIAWREGAQWWLGILAP